MSATTDADTPSTIEELPDDAPTGIVSETGTPDVNEPATEATDADAAHLAGGIGAWKTAGLPCIRLDPSTGQIIDSGKY